MKGFLFCLVLLAGAGFGAYYMGWLSWETTEDGKTQISIDNDKFKEDADKAIDKGRDAIDKAKDAINKDGDPENQETGTGDANVDQTGDDNNG